MVKYCKSLWLFRLFWFRNLDEPFFYISESWLFSKISVFIDYSQCQRRSATKHCQKAKLDHRAFGASLFTLVTAL